MDGNLSSPWCIGFMYDPQRISDRPVRQGFPPVRGGFDRGITVFVPELSNLYIYGGIYELRMGACRPRVALALFSSPSQSAIGRRGWGFHTVRGGFDLGDPRFRPQVVGVEDVWRDF